MDQPNPAVSFKDDLKLMKNENGFKKNPLNNNKKQTRNSEDLNWLNKYAQDFLVNQLNLLIWNHLNEHLVQSSSALT